MVGGVDNTKRYARYDRQDKLAGRCNLAEWQTSSAQKVPPTDFAPKKKNGCGIDADPRHFELRDGPKLWNFSETIAQSQVAAQIYDLCIIVTAGIRDGRTLSVANALQPHAVISDLTVGLLVGAASKQGMIDRVTSDCELRFSGEIGDLVGRHALVPVGYHFPIDHLVHGRQLLLDGAIHGRRVRFQIKKY
jgi:hypothetical protein